MRKRQSHVMTAEKVQFQPPMRPFADASQIGYWPLAIGY